VAFTAFASGCSQNADVRKGPPPPAPPPGQVWISRDQLALAQIEVGAIGEQDVNEVVAVTGRITFDDLRVAHIFSPVTGRVTNIAANLGQTVKQGALLATIVSPDIGVASSNLSKAEADVIAAQHDFKRKQELLEEHAAAPADVEASEDNLRRTRAERQRACSTPSASRARTSRPTSPPRLPGTCHAPRKRRRRSPICSPRPDVSALDYARSPSTSRRPELPPSAPPFASCSRH